MLLGDRDNSASFPYLRARARVVSRMNGTAIKPCWPSTVLVAVYGPGPAPSVFLARSVNVTSERDGSSSAAESIAIFSLFSQTSGEATQRNPLIARTKARTRRIEEFQRKQYLECVAFIVLLLAGTYQQIEGQVWMKQRSSDWWERIVSV